NILRILLQFAQTRPYEVKEGDNIDFIIRKLFLVSATKRNAYSVYLDRVYELNPDLRNASVLTVGRRIEVPTGPTFAGSRIRVDGLGGFYNAVLTRMSRKA